MTKQDLITEALKLKKIIQDPKTTAAEADWQKHLFLVTMDRIENKEYSV